MYLNKKIHFYITWGITFSSEMLNFHTEDSYYIKILGKDQKQNTSLHFIASEG